MAERPSNSDRSFDYESVKRDLLETLKRDLESITDRSNELNDASKDRDVTSSGERDYRVDSATTEHSQDVDSIERIRTNAVDYDLVKDSQEAEAAKRDRSAYDADLNDERKVVSSLDSFQQRQLDKDSTFISDLREMRLRHLEDLHTAKMERLRDHSELKLKLWENIMMNSDALKNQERRHVDHTLTDLHAADGEAGKPKC